MLKREALKKEKAQFVNTTGIPLDDEGKATASMLAEIRQLMQSGPQAQPAKGQGKPISDGPPNPLGVVPPAVKALQNKQAKKAKILAKAVASSATSSSVPSQIPGGKKITHDQLLSHLLSQPRAGPLPGYTAEELKVKVVAAPYVDVIVNVEQRLWMEEYLQKQRDAALSQPPGSKPIVPLAWHEPTKEGDADSSTSSVPSAVPRESKAEANRRKYNEAMIEAGLAPVPPAVTAVAPSTASSMEAKKVIADATHLTPAQIKIRQDNTAIVEKYKRRYPRLITAIGLTSNMQFAPYPDQSHLVPDGTSSTLSGSKADILDLSKLVYRSDNWMVRFMEDCYDEAAMFIEKKGISDNRRRKRCGLDLGGLDAFPLVVERWLSRTFSTMEFRRRATLEILATLDHVAAVAELALLASTFGQDSKSMTKGSASNSLIETEASSIKNIHPLISIDGGRAALFAKFLAEEFDVDYLAMYLLTRSRLQKSLGIQLRELAPMLLNEVAHAFPDPPAGLITANAFGSEQALVDAAPPPPKKLMGSSIHGTTFDGIATGPLSKHKFAPISLPNYMDFISDVTMPNANLAAIAHERLTWLVEKLIPGCSITQRTYFIDKVLEMTETQLKNSNKRLEMLLPLHTVLPAECQPSAMGICIGGAYYVPVFNLLQAVCEQWKMVPPETKGSFSASGSTSGNLTQLNTFHDNDNALMKGMKQKIKATNQDINTVSGDIMKLDKKRRRIERKWKFGLTSETELTELTATRVAIVEQEAEKDGLQSKLENLQARYQALQVISDNLWSAAASSQEISAAPGAGKGSSASVLEDGSVSTLVMSTWKSDCTTNLLCALTFNHENVLAIEENKRAMAKLGDVLIQSAKEHEMEVLAKQALVVKEPTLDDLVKSIEAEALSLAKVGHNEIFSLGMLPPPAPYISSYQTKAVINEIKELQLAQEREAELGEREVMRREELRVHEADAYAQHMREHMIRLKLLQEQRERDLQRAAVMHVAMQEIHAYVSNALEVVAAETQRKRLEELALEEERLLAEDSERQAVARLRAEIGAVVASSLSLGLERAKAGFIEKARLMALEEERERQELLQKQMIAEMEAAKIRRQELMKLRIAETSRMAVESVVVSLQSAVISVTNVTVAEMQRQEMLRIVELEKEEQRKQAIALQELTLKHEKIRRVVVQGMGRVLGGDVVAMALNNAEIYFWQQEMERQKVLEQLQREKEELLSLTALAALMDLGSELASTPSGQKSSPPFLELVWQECVNEYVEEEAERVEAELKRAKEEAIRAAKALKNLQYRISRTSRALIKIALETGTAQAHATLTHPDLQLDLDPTTWLSEATLMEVEEMYLIQRMVKERVWKQALFKASTKGRTIRKKHAAFLEKHTFNAMRKILEDRRRLHTMSRRITKTIRSYALALKTFKFNQALDVKNTKGVAMSKRRRLQRLHKMVKWWKYWAHVEARAAVVVRNIYEREYMKAWMTWKYKYRLRMEHHARELSKHNRALLKVSSLIKMWIVKRRRFRRKMLLRILNCARRYLSRKRVFEQKMRVRARYDLTKYLGYRNRWYAYRASFKEWRRIESKSNFFNHLHLFLMRKFVRRRFRAWKFGARDRGVVRSRAAVQLQSAVRMWIIKRYVLNYYRWRRGLVCFQSHVRRKACDAWFAYNLRLFRAARKIQKVYRGWELRSRHTDRRIMDIHFAAGSNNYDKLNYYVQKYPELLNELDRFGNTALHNAAKNAARRTLKLLLKAGLDPNALNLAGLSPLHVIIMGHAISRDDCCLYMLENAHRLGFNHQQRTPEGRTCLHLAVEQGRYRIIETLLDMELPVNLPDQHGTTPLQLSFSAGVLAITELLINHGADVNMPGYCGTLPLHDCIGTGDIKFPNLLINHGAYVNVTEPYHKQTPLHWAAKAGLPEFVRLFVLQGAHVYAQDIHGWTAAHHAAANGTEESYEPLREGESDFDSTDLLGKSPLHIAAEYGNTAFAKNLLLGCANVHLQDNEGNQPSHIAARDNKLETLQMICTYDQHIGRVNFHHQTPLGIAKFYGAKDTQVFLEKHYRIVDAEAGRNEVGDIWWDREVDDVAGGWKVRVDEHNNRTYVNVNTGEISADPPLYNVKQIAKQALNAEVTMKRAVVLVGKEHENSTTRHGYLADWEAARTDINEMIRLDTNAAVIQCMVRRKLAYLKRKFLLKVKAKRRIMAKFIKRHLRGFMNWKLAGRNKAFSILQAKFKGDRFRRQWRREGPPLGPLREPLWKVGYKHQHIKDIFAYINYLRSIDKYDVQGFYEDRPYPYGLYNWRIRHVKTLYLSRVVKNAWIRYRYKKNVARLEMFSRQPKTDKDWQLLVKNARYVNRVVGVYSEYMHPDYTQFRLMFYKHNVSNHFSLEKPKKLIAQDERLWREANETRMYGTTLSQMARITKVQALYRGYKIRSYYTAVETALLISDNAERQYMTYPDQDASLYNYALHCHVITQDFNRARVLYAEGLRRMEWRGPDVAFLLYSYAIFSFVTHSLDYSDIVELLNRARKAEEVREQQLRQAKGEEPSQAILNGTYVHGKVYNLANIGFFRKFANEKKNADAWHSYAACRFLVYGDFAGSFDAFLEAFRYSANDKFIKSNFDIMMRHFHGYDKRKLESIVTERMRYLANLAVKIVNAETLVRETARAKKKAANRIQQWYRTCLNQRGLRLFMQTIRKAKLAKMKS